MPAVEALKPSNCATIIDMAMSTCANALSACVTTPNSTAPLMYIGATITAGITSAT